MLCYPFLYFAIHTFFFGCFVLGTAIKLSGCNNVNIKIPTNVEEIILENCNNCNIICMGVERMIRAEKCENLSILCNGVYICTTLTFYFCFFIFIFYSFCFNTMYVFFKQKKIYGKTRKYRHTCVTKTQN